MFALGRQANLFRTFTLPEIL
ncbi:hypothetical protein BVI2075_350020 [Burkholderia vietnamiensis]|nr:hypothetical protein BVI2075_350020 [Burkholderia vietnamiensis]